MSKKTRGHFEKDITGEVCAICNVGTAKVIYWEKRNRFFFGCSSSSKTNPCPGTKQWQSVDVPKELRNVPDWAVKSVGVVEDDRISKKRPIAAEGIADIIEAKVVKKEECP